MLRSPPDRRAAWTKHASWSGFICPCPGNACCGSAANSFTHFRNMFSTTVLSTLAALVSPQGMKIKAWSATDGNR